MAHIAFLGTGLLGSAFAEAAAKRGDTVTAWNRSPDKVAAPAAIASRLDRLIAAGHGAEDFSVLALDAVRRA